MVVAVVIGELIELGRALVVAVGVVAVVAQVAVIAGFWRPLR